MDDLRYFVERERLAAQRREAEEDRLARLARQQALADRLERGLALPPFAIPAASGEPAAPLLAVGRDEVDRFEGGQRCACAPGCQPV